MLKAIFILLGNIIVLPINLILFIPRLIYKLIVNFDASLWIVVGKKKKILEVDGNVKIK